MTFAACKEIKVQFHKYYGLILSKRKYLSGILPLHSSSPRRTLAMAAIIDGGHVRVGFEDNVYLSKGVLAKSNGELVAKVVRMAKELGREVPMQEVKDRLLEELLKRL